MAYLTEWSETGTAEDDVVEVIRAGESGKIHYITSVIASITNASNPRSLQVKAGTGLVVDVEIIDEFTMKLDSAPFRGRINKPVSATLDASTGMSGTVTGFIALMGYTL